ncbi:hypothetical protein ADL00_34615 [Streptomyces sp. AS58]|uniref:putative quinol monooxygenase n=1 Tax=Streptomyces sp. AS58 TaxID=1519489 RepID=UPI0006AD9B64|nr:antibiotic biosynthesis monooxygenase [Streptomyces sp. AS58]KOV53273.1 hypothetical protein ADL00_34615 [Streptomyces sp. AS58]
MILARFKMKSGCKEEFLRLLQPVLEGVAKDPACACVVVHDNPEDAQEIILYEIWKGTVEEFLRVELAKPYRVEYMARMPELIVEKTVEWLAPLSEWASDLTSSEDITISGRGAGPPAEGERRGQ